MTCGSLALCRAVTIQAVVMWHSTIANELRNGRWGCVKDATCSQRKVTRQPLCGLGTFNAHENGRQWSQLAWKWHLKFQTSLWTCNKWFQTVWRITTLHLNCLTTQFCFWIVASLQHAAVPCSQNAQTRSEKQLTCKKLAISRHPAKHGFATLLYNAVSASNKLFFLNG